MFTRVSQRSNSGDMHLDSVHLARVSLRCPDTRNLGLHNRIWHDEALNEFASVEARPNSARLRYSEELGHDLAVTLHSLKKLLKLGSLVRLDKYKIDDKLIYVTYLILFSVSKFHLRLCIGLVCPNKIQFHLSLIYIKMN